MNPTPEHRDAILADREKAELAEALGISMDHDMLKQLPTPEEAVEYLLQKARHAMRYGSPDEVITHTRMSISIAERKDCPVYGGWHGIYSETALEMLHERLRARSCDRALS